MAAHFKISVHRNDENLHLKLMGDFDETSAHELVNILKRCAGRTSRVFIHTSCLRRIRHLGVKALHNNLSGLKGKSTQIIFTGEHAFRLAPEEPVPFNLTVSSASQVPGYGAPITSLPLRESRGES
jgi:anti-anti-sigma regulatory factor